MGEVYRARDTRLDRSVAIKILRHELSASEDLRRRFEREARAVSSLNHPHICALYDVGRENELDFLVLEHLEGETLADRLKRGALPLEESLRRAIEIVTALEAAHRCGVIHRDLKSGNIMLTKFGAKLLDFGLARLKPVKPASAPGEPAPLPDSLEPTLTAEASVLGTAPYMSPEQIEGKEADARSDIFSAGVVIYEMTTGQRPFEGSSPAAVMSAILRAEPIPMSRVRPGVPRSLDALVAQCLAKDPEERRQSAHDIGLELRSILEQLLQPEAGGASEARRSRGTRLGWIAGAVGLAALAAALLLIRASRAPARQETIRFSLDLPPGTTYEEPFWSHPAVSPDGRNVAFVAISGGSRSLWVRALDGLSSRLIAGTEDALAPFWSPDSRFIAYFARGKLMSVANAGGAPHSICDVAAVSACGSWGSSGTIVFGIWEAPGQNGLYRVAASGGTATRLSLRADKGPPIEQAFYPEFLRDGRRFLFLGSTSSTSAGLFIAALDDERATFVRAATSRVEYVQSGYLLGVAENTLFAQRFDANRARVEGGPIPIAENLDVFALGAAFSFSENGLFVYQARGVVELRLAWFDRAGHELGAIGSPGAYEGLRLSPDDQRLVVATIDPRTNHSDLWVYKIPGGTPTRLTSEPDEQQWRPVWSPDGREIAYSRARAAPPNLFRMRLGDPKPEQLVPMNGHVQWMCDWSPDGRTLIYTDRDPRTWTDLWTLDLEGDRKPVPWLQTRFKEDEAQFSPNGRWVAYASDETGRFEIYVRPSSGTGETRRVSSAGGLTPRWRADGRELFYVNLEPEPSILSAPLDPASAELLRAPRPLFHLSTPIHEFDVTRDGQRFVVSAEANTGTRTLANVVVNWAAKR